jgi:hypothetical protein
MPADRRRTRELLALLVPLCASAAWAGCRKETAGPGTNDGMPIGGSSDRGGAATTLERSRVGGEAASRGGDDPAGPGDPGTTPPVDPPVAAAAPAPPPVVPTLDDYRRVARPIVCERSIRCGALGASQREACLAGGDALFPDPVMGLWDRLDWPEGVAEGRLAYDAEASAACLAFLRDGPCRYDPADRPPGCTTDWPVLAARVPPGGACVRWEECVGGFCSAQTACRGRCIAYLSTGEACGSNTLCGKDDFCDDGVCTPRRALGESCPGHWQACRDGLRCEGYVPENDGHEWWHPEIPGTCALPKEAGAPCATVESGDERCRADLYCDWGLREPVCSAWLGEGAECRWPYACADGLSCRGLRLGGRHPAGRRYGVLAGGRCLPFLDAGDTCDPDADVSGCPGSMRCDPESRTCLSSGRLGDPCESIWVPPDTPDDRPIRRAGCGSGLYCDVETRRCRRQLDEGARCTPRADLEDETCFLGTCDPNTRRCRHRCDDR